MTSAGPATGLRVLPVRSRRDRRRFLGLTRSIYAQDPAWVQGKPSLAQSLLHAGNAFSCPVVALCDARDHGEGAMPEIVQVADNLGHGTAIGEANGGVRRTRVVHVGADIANIVSLQQTVGCRIARFARQHEAIDAVYQELLDLVVLLFRLVVRGGQKECLPLQGQAVLKGLDNGREDGVVQGRYDRPDGVRSTRDQRPRRPVRRIAELCDGLLHPLSDLGPHLVRHREAARHGGGRDRRATGHVMERWAQKHLFLQTFANLCHDHAGRSTIPALDYQPVISRITSPCGRSKVPN